MVKKNKGIELYNLGKKYILGGNMLFSKKHLILYNNIILCIIITR